MKLEAQLRHTLIVKYLMMKSNNPSNGKDVKCIKGVKCIRDLEVVRAKIKCTFNRNIFILLKIIS